MGPRRKATEPARFCVRRGPTSAETARMHLLPFAPGRRHELIVEERRWHGAADWTWS